jgi:rpsU-divergently transcribed protein
MRAALANVPELGWTDDAVAKAVKEVGYDSIAHKMIDHGAADLVRYFMQQKRVHVQQFISDKYPPHDDEHEEDEDAATHAKLVVHDAIACHMEYIAPYKASWPSALAVVSEPSQLPKTLEVMADTADDICHLAGMNSSRLDWYTDRALILMVYGTTEMYMLTDYSDDMHDTKQFLRTNVEFWRTNVGLFNLLKSQSTVLSSLSSVWDTIVTGFISQQARRGQGAGAPPADASNNSSTTSSSSSGSNPDSIAGMGLPPVPPPSGSERP